MATVHTHLEHSSLKGISGIELTLSLHPSPWGEGL